MFEWRFPQSFVCTHGWRKDALLWHAFLLQPCNIHSPRILFHDAAFLFSWMRRLFFAHTPLNTTTFKFSLPFKNSNLIKFFPVRLPLELPHSSVLHTAQLRLCIRSRPRSRKPGRFPFETENWFASQFYLILLPSAIISILTSESHVQVHFHDFFSLNFLHVLCSSRKWMAARQGPSGNPITNP